MIDIFTGFFSNPFNIVIGLIFLLGGILVGIFLVRYVMKPKNQILYCRERDGRGLELGVGKEDAISLETHSSPPLRFFKYGRSYEFRRRGRAFTRFFGKEGTAYTWLLEGFHKVATKFKEITEIVEVKDEKTGKFLPTKVTHKVPVEWEEKKLKLSFPTLEDALKFKWAGIKTPIGRDFYDTVPEKAKHLLRDDKILLTVNLEPGIVPEGYEPITESTIMDKADEDMAHLLARSMKSSVKTTLMDWLPWLLAGAGLMAVGSKLLGWW